MGKYSNNGFLLLMTMSTKRTTTTTTITATATDGAYHIYIMEIIIIAFIL